MAIRTTTKLVEGIVEYEESGAHDAYLSLTPFIQQANILTDWLSSVDTDNELNSDCLIKIETLLAAHFYSVQLDKQYASKSTDGASGSFDGQTGFSLQATHHGQTALLLDVTGQLAKRNLEAQQGKRVSRLIWIGHQDHSEDPYD